MNINRWIFVPLTLAVLNAIVYGLFFPNPSFGILAGFITGAITGLILQVWSEYRNKNVNNASENKDFTVKQKRTITLLLNIETAFETCKGVLSETEGISIKVADHERFIRATSNMNFHSFGTEISINLSAINENLTEVEILTSPALKTTIVDYGESLRIIEEISSRLNEFDAYANQQVLLKSGDLLDEVYVKPFEKKKEKVPQK